MEKFENVTYFNHPLIQHKISILRKKETGTNEFRHRFVEGHYPVREIREGEGGRFKIGRAHV